MRAKYTLTLVRICVVALFLSGLFSRCASIMSPDGGPKDSLPPVIVALNPDNFTTNFSANRIYIEFDEFIKLVDQQKEVYTSPKMKYAPSLQMRGRGVLVSLRDTLKENTTYAINFGSAIQDNNEGNPLSSMRYVFSTGDEIDSMILSGYTEDSFKADSVGKSYIYLYIKDSTEIHPTYDSTLLLREPSVIARAENNGIFIAQNLKPIDYYVYAFEDANGTQLYEPGEERVGFLDGTFNPSQMPEFSIWRDSLRGYIVAEPQFQITMFTDKGFKRQILSDSKRDKQHMATLYFGGENPHIDSIVFDGIPNDELIVEPLSYRGDTVVLWFTSPSAMLPDTIRGEITYSKHDSVNILRTSTDKLALAWRKIESKEQERERKNQERAKERAERDGQEYEAPYEKSPFEYTITASSPINPEKNITIDFAYPISNYNISEFQMYAYESDTEERLKVQFVADTQNLRRWHILSDWSRTNKDYELVIPTGAITNIAGEKNDTITHKFNVMKADDYATMIIDLKVNKDDRSRYIVQITNSSGKTLAQKTGLSAGKVTFKYIPAGDVQLRVIQDKNLNNRLDMGSLVDRRLAELSKIYTMDGEKIFTAKVNWEMELTVDIEELFAPETMDQLNKRLDDQERERVEKIVESERARGSNDSSTGSGFGLGGAMSPTSLIN